MSFVDRALEFPTVIFTVLMLVSLGWWLMSTLFGAGDFDLDGVTEGVADALHLTGVPLALSVTIMSSIGWLVSFLLMGLIDGNAIGWALVVIALAFIVGVVVASLAARPLAKALETVDADPRASLVGSPAIVRTETVTSTFGQVEITDRIGATILAEARTQGQVVVRRDDQVFVVDHNESGEYYLVVPADLSFDEEPKRAKGDSGE